MLDNKSTSATNKLGQLYVEFGTKGLGGVLTGLNGISAGFLNAASLAQKAVKSTGEFYKGVGQGAVALDKASLLTNLPLKQVEQLQSWAKLNDISFDNYIGQMSKMQQMVLDMQMGKGTGAEGFNLLGIDPTSYDVEKNPLALMNAIQKRVNELYKSGGGTRALAGLRAFGMDEEMLYTFIKANQILDKNLSLTDRQLNLYIEEKKALNELGVAWDKMIQKAMASKSIVEMTKDVVNILKQANILLNKNEEKNGKSLYQKSKENVPNIISKTPFAMPLAVAAGVPLMIKGTAQRTPQNITAGNSTQAVYNIVNNNTLNNLEDLGMIDYVSKVQAQYNNAQNFNSGRH